MNFVNFHILISHSPSCLNRDDMNMQKAAVFGGVRRVRISSQSLKRSMRFSPYYEDQFGQPSVRTRELEKLKIQFVEALKDEFEPSVVTKTMDLFVKDKGDNDESEDADKQEEDAVVGENKKLAVAPWALAEIRALCAIVKNISLTAAETSKAKADAAKQKGKKKRSESDFIEEALTKKCAKVIQEKIESVRIAIGSTLDIALSGRMTTSGLMTPVDGALAVAHALTTHAVEGDVDWFTAVDDLVVGAGEVGAGHLNTQEFSSGVFYRYASLNLKQLQVNLGLLPNIKAAETAESRARALDVARHVLHLLATVVPSAKQQSFAAHNLADFALVSLSSQPVSLANAFEHAVQSKQDGYLTPSIHNLCGYWQRLHDAYGLNERAAAFALGDGCSGDTLTAFNRLPDLEAWVVADGRQGGA